MTREQRDGRAGKDTSGIVKRKKMERGNTERQRWKGEGRELKECKRKRGEKMEW
jgi:hypothetical protein